ncbi:sulfite exporter TauE/SafE family protein [Aquipseudomonas guryensis]|uniref:sulfite exporter TauE/SafE family protein n=1 Tax=Aquipseudomonas guryensis TaxID=2759165 RepID=UPI0038B2F07E
MSEVLINIGLGLCLGTIGGLFGIGGGLIAIPMLGLLFGLDQHLAQGTALVMVVPNVMLALWRYNQRNRLNWRWAAVLALAGFCWALLGANLAASLSATLMRQLFVVFLLTLMLYNGWRLYRPVPLQSAQGAPSTGQLAVLGTFAGLAGGLFGVGGAVVATPVLTSVFGLSQVAAQGLALAMALPSTGVTLATFAAHGQVAWGMGLALSCGGLLSISWGVRIAHALPDKLLRLLFCGFLLACSLGLLLQ